MILKKFILLCLFISSLFAMEKELISIVRVNKAIVYNKDIAQDKYKADIYPRGKVLKLESCNKYDWCKIKDKELYISRIILGIVEVEKIKNKKPEIIKQIIKNLPKKDIKKVKKNIQIKKQTKPVCIKLKEINLDENEIFTKDIQNIQFKKYINKCISGKLLKSLINTTSSFYLKEGYITTKAYLKEQDIKDGEIDISILKGKIEKIIHNDTNSSSWKIATAFIGQKDKILNLRELETSLEMMNRVNSSDSSFNLKPGKTQGSSIVDIKTKKNFPVHLNLGVSGDRDNIKDNDPNYTGILTIDNLVGINDILTFTYNGSRIQKEYQSTKGDEINYSFSIGSYLISLKRSNSKYRRGVEGINDTYLSNGETIGSRLALSKILTRNQTNKLESEISIYHKNSKNYFEKSLIEVSSYKTTLLQVDIKHTNYQPWGQNYTVYSIYQGKDWFDAKGDVDLNGESDYLGKKKLEFTKYTIDNTLFYFFKDRSYRFSSNFKIQNTNDKLFASDQLSVGGLYTVRGYDDSNYYGNNGFFIKNDFSKTFSPNLQKNTFKDISFFIGLDGGNVKCEEDNENICGKIYGKAIGFNTSSENLSSDFTWSRAIEKISDDFKKETLFNFNIKVSF